MTLDEATLFLVQRMSYAKLIEVSYNTAAPKELRIAALKEANRRDISNDYIAPY